MVVTEKLSTSSSTSVWHGHGAQQQGVFCVVLKHAALFEARSSTGGGGAFVARGGTMLAEASARGHPSNFECASRLKGGRGRLRVSAPHADARLA